MKKIERLRKDTKESQKELKKAEQATLNKQRAEEKFKKLGKGYRGLKQGENILEKVKSQPLKINAK